MKDNIDICIMFDSITDAMSGAFRQASKSIDDGVQAVTGTAPASEVDADARLLEGLGYEQELFRGLDSVMTFSFGFGQVSCYIGILSLFTFGLSTGGPVTMVWGWLVASALTCIVGACLGEICSAYPSAGSVYYWAGQLAPPKHFALASYWAGYFNWIGNATAIPSVAYMVALFIEETLKINGYQDFGGVYRVVVTIAVMLLTAALNFLRIDQIGWLSVLGAIVQICTMIAIVICVLSMTPSMESWEFVLFKWENDTGFNSSAYVVIISVLFPLFSFVGYDASSHMAEETQNSTLTAPWAIFNTCTSSVVAGIVFIMALLFACQNIPDAIDSDLDNAGLYIIFSATNKTTASVLFSFIALSALFATLSTTSVAARMTFACVRDGMSPMHELLAKVDPTYQTPVNAIIFNFAFDVLLSLGLMLPLVAIGQDTLAYNSLAAIVTLGFQFSYAIPIGLKALAVADHPFPESAFTLGKFSTPACWIAFVWLVFTAIAFMLPLESPVTGATMNYAVVVVLIVTILGYFNWLYITSRPNEPFVGPARAKEAKATESSSLLNMFGM